MTAAAPRHAVPAGTVPGLPGLPQGTRCLVMGVLNVTPDSFSDGGRYVETGTAVSHGLALAADGADLVDVGGESTRPGAGRVEPAEERRRVLPVVRELAAAGVPVSIDTTRAAVAEAAVAAGARLINDVSGAQADPAMASFVAGTGVPYVLVHSRGPSADMRERAAYDDVVRQVCAELRDRLDALTAAGVAADRVILDPGLGFAKTGAHNWQLLAALPRLHTLGRPLLIGASRKAFLGALLAPPGGSALPAGQRDGASHALAAIAAYEGAWGVRVHAAGPAAEAVRVAAAVRGAAGP